ncbi:MAG: cell wall hydrolase [Shewanella oncorhynchi]
MTQINAATFIAAVTLYAESDPNNVDDAQKIAAVIVNRTKNPAWWGNDLRTVCLEKYQFSCWNWRFTGASDSAKARISPFFSDINLLTPKPMDTIKSEWLSECYAIVEQAVQGFDPTEGADHYHASYINKPSWAVGMVRTTASVFNRETFSGHQFYQIGHDGAYPQIAKRSKRITGATAASGTMAVAAVTDLASNNSALETMIEAAKQSITTDSVTAVAQKIPDVVQKIGGHMVPASALWFVTAMLVGVVGYMIWTRRVDNPQPSKLPFERYGE